MWMGYNVSVLPLRQAEKSLKPTNNFAIFGSRINGSGFSRYIALRTATMAAGFLNRFFSFFHSPRILFTF